MSHPSRVRRRLRSVAAILLAIAGGMALLALVLAPPGAAAPAAHDWTPGSPIARGAFHVHSARSDGTGTIDEIAAAAARAGLQFVIVTDHGDGTRPPDPPAYRSGVLCLDAVEVSTTHGHLVALGVPQMPFRLAGHPRDVLEDVHRVGGFAIAAHPGSPKPDLRWRDWGLPFDGVEWLNADSEWRDERWSALGRALLTYPIRPAETLASLIDRPAAVLEQWDRLTRQRHVVAIAGADAHARLGIRSTSEPYEDRVVARLPSYEASFRAFANHVLLDTTPTGDAAADAAALLDAIRRGRAFTSLEGLARLGAFALHVRGGGKSALIGEYLETPQPVELEARIAAPAETTLVLLKDGKPLRQLVGERLRVTLPPEAAVYRVEAYFPGPAREGAVPWLVTNPVYVNLRAAHAAPRHSRAAVVAERTPIVPEWWGPEASEDSRSVVDVIEGTSGGAGTVSWRLQLADAPPVAQYAAIAFGSHPQFAGYDRIHLRARASRPMRLWAQLRAPGPGGGRRWARSVYMDPDPRAIELRFDEFLPVGRGPEPDRARADEIESFLFVVDTLNTLPGTAADITIDDVRLERTR